jgi:hypothetical protein
VTTALRLFTVIPAAVLVATLSGGGFWTGSGNDPGAYPPFRLAA